MDIAWGEKFGDQSQGLDIIGVLGLDQSLEAALANGITTISIRGRYFSILPWAIGEFFANEIQTQATHFDSKRFQAFLARVEFLVLACTSLDKTGGDAGGALGANTFRMQMAALSRGETVPYPATGNSSILGTYFGPCRAIGLVRSATGANGEPFLLTPRGQELWKARNEAIGDGDWRDVLWKAETLSAAQVNALLPHFALQRLSSAVSEAEALRSALLTPWVRDGSAAASVDEAYKRFNQTVDWLRKDGKTTSFQANLMLARIWERASQDREGLQDTEIAWAEFEWRSRLHFALELLMSAICDTLQRMHQATLEEMLEDWFSASDIPSRLATAWPEAGEAIGSLPSDLYLTSAIPGDLGGLQPHARALFGFALIATLGLQSESLRAHGLFRDRRSHGKDALACLARDGERPFQEALRDLCVIVISAHLGTTFRKMGAGQKCSLRFFFDGPRLSVTKLGSSAGRSGIRLWNVIRVLRDAAMPGIGVEA